MKIPPGLNPANKHAGKLRCELFPYLALIYLKFEYWTTLFAQLSMLKKEYLRCKTLNQNALSIRSPKRLCQTSQILFSSVPPFL